MTCAEHLIENALVTLENGKNFECFEDESVNQEMSETTGIKLEDVWAMACHVYFVLKPDWEVSE